MDLYLVRHASAYDRDSARWPDDHLRPLTPRGEKHFRTAARGARRLLTTPDVVLASPSTRAWSTARLLSREARWPEARRCDVLAGDNLDAIRAAIEAERSASVLAVVGHEPYLSLLMWALLGGSSDIAIDFKKGAIAWLRWPADDGPITLEAMLPPRVLRASASTHR